jgi:hypothetical protein
MSKGPGRVQRAMLELFSTLDTREENFIQVTTKDFCRVVFETEQVTKAQQVSVLRVIKRLPDGSPLPGAPLWRIQRASSGRFWFLERAMPAPPPQRQPKPKVDRKLAAALRLLASNHPGERDAALLAAQRLLEAKGLDWNDVATMVDRGVGNG